MGLWKTSTSIFQWIYMFEMSRTRFVHFWKMSVYICMPLKFCGHCSSRFNARKLIKLHAQMLFDIIWYWLVLGVYRLTGGAAMQNFFLNFGLLIIHNVTSSIAWNWTKFYVRHTIVRKNFYLHWYKSVDRWLCYTTFP